MLLGTLDLQKRKFIYDWNVEDEEESSASKKVVGKGSKTAIPGL